MNNNILLTIVICILLIQTSNAQWVQVNNGLGNTNVNALANDGNNVFAGSGEGLGVLKSTNNGTTWTQTTLNNLDVLALSINANNIFAGTYFNGVYRSTDNGTSWTQTSLNNRKVSALSVNANNIFAGTDSNGGVYRSTDNGTSWTQTPLNNRDIRSLAVNGNYIFAGTYNYPNHYGVYLSTDNGTTWTQTSLNDKFVLSLALNGNNIFAGTGGNDGVYRSTDNGTSWTHTSLINKQVISLAINGTNIFAGTDDFGVYVSNNNGTNWLQRNEGMVGPSVYALCILNNYIFAGVSNSQAEDGVWRRLLSEVIGIQQISSEIPKTFSLLQNYPNPFNPTTQIEFSIPKNNELVKLTVFDITGKEIAILVNQQLNAGTFKADFDPGNLASGLYFYKLVAGDYMETKKMILIK